jgi:hypothetical protein
LNLTKNDSSVKYVRLKYKLQSKYRTQSVQNLLSNGRKINFSAILEIAAILKFVKKTSQFLQIFEILYAQKCGKK